MQGPKIPPSVGARGHRANDDRLRSKQLLGPPQQVAEFSSIPKSASALQQQGPVSGDERHARKGRIAWQLLRHEADRCCLLPTSSCRLPGSQLSNSLRHQIHDLLVLAGTHLAEDPTQEVELLLVSSPCCRIYRPKLIGVLRSGTVRAPANLV